jgi:hypothetical protein
MKKTDPTKEMMKKKIIARLKFCSPLPKDRIAVACGVNVNRRMMYEDRRYDPEFAAAFAELLNEGVIERATGAYAGMYRLV